MGADGWTAPAGAMDIRPTPALVEQIGGGSGQDYATAGLAARVREPLVAGLKFEARQSHEPLLLPGHRI